MRAYSVLDRYIGSTIFTAIMTTLFILVSLSSMIKFVEQLKKVGEGSYDLLGAGIYIFLSAPKDIQIFFPMAVLLGALLGLGILTQSNELTGMQALGYTHMKLTLSITKTTIPLLFLSMAVNEWVAPRGEEIARNYRSQAMYGGSLLSTQHGLWVKDGRQFIYIEHLKGHDELNGVNIYSFNEKYRLQSLRYAEVAKFDPKCNLWSLLKVKESNLQDPKEIIGSQTLSATWETNLTPDKLGVIALNPDALSINSLYNYIKYLRLSGQDTKRYQLSMWRKIFQPISVGVMELVGVSFIFSPLTNPSTSVCVVTGISLGFLFYILDQMIGPLTLMCGMTPITSALLPSISFFLISIFLLLKKRS